MFAHKVILTTDEDVIIREFVWIGLAPLPQSSPLLFPLDHFVSQPRVLRLFSEDRIPFSSEKDLHYQYIVDAINPETHIKHQITLSGKGRAFCNNDTPEKIEILMLDNPVKSVVDLAEEVK